MGEDLFVFIGCLNREAPYFQGARGCGLSVYRFNENSLETELVTQTDSIDNPTYLSVDASGSRVYANSEVYQWREGLVTAFAFDRQAGELSHINSRTTLGSITAHNMISRDGTRLLVTNYAMGRGGPDQSLVVFGIREDGGLTEPLASVAHEGHGPNPERQERSHAHSFTELREGNIAVACDLGLDQLIAYRIDADGSLAELSRSDMVPGFGPRHLALHPGGRLAYVINELDSSISELAIDPADGSVRIIATQPTVPDEARAANHCADIQITPDGRFLYGSNRGDDSVTIFAVEPETGRLSLVKRVPCGGSTPRNLALTPSGRHLFSANQNGDRVSIFRCDTESGALTDTGQAIEVGTPMCVKFSL